MSQESPRVLALRRLCSSYLNFEHKRAVSAARKCPSHRPPYFSGSQEYRTGFSLTQKLLAGYNGQQLRDFVLAEVKLWYDAVQDGEGARHVDVVWNPGCPDRRWLGPPWRTDLPAVSERVALHCDSVIRNRMQELCWAMEDSLKQDEDRPPCTPTEAAAHYAKRFYEMDFMEHGHSAWYDGHLYDPTASPRQYGIHTGKVYRSLRRHIDYEGDDYAAGQQAAEMAMAEWPDLPSMCMFWGTRGRSS